MSLQFLIRRRAAVVLLALLAGLVPMLAGPAEAGPLPPITCTAAGQIVHGVGPGPAEIPWTVAGRGSCQGDMGGTYFVDIAGTGTSETLGFCSGDVLVQDLSILMTVTFTNAATGAVRVVAENWGAPATTFPVASPFLIRHDGSLVGAGTMFSHIFLRCPPGGSPVAQITWTRTSPR